MKVYVCVKSVPDTAAILQNVIEVDGPADHF